MSATIQYFLDTGQYIGQTMRVANRGDEELVFLGSIGNIRLNVPVILKTNETIEFTWNGRNWYLERDLRPDSISPEGFDLNVYVDAQFGEDYNDGRTPTTALATDAGVARRFPTFLFDNARMRVWYAGLGASAAVPGFGANAIGVQTYDVSNFHLPCIGSYVNALARRGAYMVPVTPASGPALKTVTSTTGLWIKVDSDLTVGRSRTASVASPGAGYTLWGTRLLVSGTNWTANDHQGFFARVVRAGVKVIFEMPISGNGANHLDLDFAAGPSDTPQLQDQILGGDTVEIVRPSVRMRSDPALPHLKSMSISGGGTYGTYDPTGDPWTNRGGPNGHTFERIEFAGAINFSGVHGYSFDRCLFTDGDTNFRGGAGQFVNCSCIGPTGGQSNSSGIQFQGQFSTLHDGAGPRADSAADPIYQTVDAPAIEWLVCKGALVTMGNGGGFSGGMGCSYTMERNVSVYGSTQAFAIKMWNARFYVPPAANVRNRRLLLQGSGNAGGGVLLTVGTQMKVMNDQVRLIGSGFDDVGLTGVTKTWLEAQTYDHSATGPGSAAGRWVEPRSGCILFNTET